MAGESIRVGDLQIIALSDATNPVDLPAFFPDHGPEDWQDYPEYVDEGGAHREEVNMGSYLVVSDRCKLLVDTGIGPVPLEPFPDLSGNLVPTMREQSGYGPEDVDLVFATHLHFDHIGWHVSRDESGLSATFPNARYLVPKVDWDSIFDPELPRSGAHADDYSQEAADIFHLSRPIAEDIRAVADAVAVPGGHSVTDEVTTVDTPGHTPGHQSLLISSGGERAFIVGDAIHLPVQLDVPERVMGADVHPKLGAKTRRETAEWLEEQGLMTVVGHFPHPGFGHVVRGEGKRYWSVLM